MPAARLRGLVIAALFAILAWVGIPFAVRHAVLPGPPSRHADPAAILPDDDPAALFEWYLTAVSRFATLRFRDGRQVIEALNTAAVPVEFQSLVRDLNGLLLDESKILETADGLLRNASTLIAAGKLDAARPLLVQLNRSSRRGTVLFEDLMGGFQALARQSHVESLPAEAPQRRAYVELQRIAIRVKAVLLTSGVLAKAPASVGTLAKLFPYPTSISLDVPSPTYPGRSVTVIGVVTEHAPAPSTGRRLTLLLDDQVLAQLPVGAFHFSFILPERTAPGPHHLSGQIPPQGRYLGASAQREVQVRQAIPVVRVHWPRYALAPGHIVVSGTAASEFGHITQATVRAALGQTAAETTTSALGSFQLSLDLPAALDLVGPQAVSLGLIPKEPWQAPVSVHGDLVVINLINVGLLALLVPAGGIAYAQSRRRRIAGEAATPTLAGQEMTPLTVPKPLRVLPPSTPRDHLLAAYVDAVHRVHAATGLAMRPSSTVREFAREVSLKVHSEPFAKLTKLAEVALYSPYPITQDLADEARRLHDALDQELINAVS